MNPEKAMAVIKKSRHGDMYGEPEIDSEEDEFTEAPIVTKTKIVKTLRSINGSMKEFSQTLENKLGKAFNSMAERKYGISDLHNGNKKRLALGCASLEDIQKSALTYLSNAKNAQFGDHN
jgi:hypothetical protein